MPAHDDLVPLPSQDPRSRLLPLLLFLLLAAGILAAAALSYRATARGLREQAGHELATIAALKVEELEHWRAERFADAMSIATDPALVRAADETHSPEGARRAASILSARLAAFSPKTEFSSIALVSISGAARFTAGEGRIRLQDPALRPLVVSAARATRPTLSDLHRHGEDEPVHLVIVAPLRSREEDSRWVVLAEIDPHRSLFPMLRGWPTTSPSGETLIVQRVGDEVRFANAPRHWKGRSDLTVHVSRTEVASVRAALGARGAIDGIDYRGTAVLASALDVPGSPWVALAKVDAGEALANIATLRWWTTLGTLGLLLGAASVAALWARMQKAQFERACLHAEAERRSLSHKLEHLTRYALDLILLADEDLRVLEANDRAVAACGYAREELLGTSLRDLRDPAAADGFDEHIRESIAGGATMFETSLRRKDGTSFPVEASIQCDEYEGRRYFQAIVRDTSERKRAEEALRASEAKFRAAFEFASLGIVLVAPDGLILETNRAFRRMLGFDEGTMRGIEITSLHAGRSEPRSREVLARMREEGLDRAEMPRLYRRRDGAVVETFLRVSAFRDASGTLVFALGVVEDVTEKKRMEAQLLLADRMASVGTLAAGVAHEINNPLAFILANVEFALSELRRMRVDEEIVRALEEAKDGAARVREIVRDLKAFSRPGEDERTSVDVRAVLQSAVSLTANEIRHRARLVVEAGEVPPVLATEHRLAQVLVNLLINAGQAITEGAAEKNAVRIATYAAPDGRAVIEVSDTGAGIPRELLPRIFDPFFTTKPVGVGTGLGLSICHGIVSSMGGEILVESEPGKGSRFRVFLAPAGEATAAAPAPEERPEIPSRRGRVLVVDDEPLVGRAVSRILSPAHDVVVRTSAREALEEVTREAFDVALFDLMMPDMTGMELHERLASLAPSLAAHTIFLTGGAFTPLARDFLERVPNARIEKPFEPAALREVVARVLATPATSAGGSS